MEGDHHKRAVPDPVPVLAGGLDEGFDFLGSEVFAASQRAVGFAFPADCSLLGRWWGVRDQGQMIVFLHGGLFNCSLNGPSPKSNPPTLPGLRGIRRSRLRKISRAACPVVFSGATPVLCHTKIIKS
jgi:hypothetical protein